MSFILDALKKAEQKHREGSVPDLQTMHIPESPSPRKRSLWLIVLTAVLVVNGGLLAWLVFKSPESGGGRVAEVAPAPAPVSAQKKGPKTVARNTPATPEARKELSPPPPIARNDERATAAAASRKISLKTSSPEKIKGALNETASPSTVMKEKGTETARPPVAASPTSTGLPPVDGRRVYELDELPEKVRQGVPALTLSLHFYTPGAAARMVRINGRNLREGDTVSGGLTVDEITPEGVIFKLQGYRFEVPALTVGRRNS